MGSTLVTTGDRIDNDTNKICFVIGAYRQGPVYETRVLLTTAVHPGESVSHATGAAGEDSYLITTDKCVYFYGIVELDKGIIETCATDYTITTDYIPVIPGHLNPGAYIRNVQCTDPTTNVEPDGGLCTAGTAGSLAQVVEPTLATEADNLGFNAAATNGANGTSGTLFMGRIPMRSAYYLADPSAAYTDVAYFNTV